MRGMHMSEAGLTTVIVHVTSTTGVEGGFISESGGVGPRDALTLLL